MWLCAAPSEALQPKLGCSGENVPNRAKDVPSLMITVRRVQGRAGAAQGTKKREVASCLNIAGPRGGEEFPRTGILVEPQCGKAA